MRDPSDTICAPSTPSGRAGLAVVRVSGSETFALVRRIFQGRRMEEPFPDRYAMLGTIVDPGDGSEIDEAIATCYRAPHSYTGEDMCEFSLHGSPVLVSATLDALCRLGARIADPGEFTMRAFLHGRIDLVQAEAVRDIIESTTLYQAQVAARQRAGVVGRQIRPIKQRLIDVIVHLESTVEFAEEDLPVDSRASILGKLESVQNELRGWIETYRRGRIVRDGFSMAIVGGPNVGKSSLFNALLSQNRSIVAEIPGTTRDLVSESINLGGVPVRLLDTAGIHDSEDHIERLGIDRSRQAIADADAILHVGDASRPFTQRELALKEQLRDLHRVAVLNKCDLPSCWSREETKCFLGDSPHAIVSAKTLAGVDGLRTLILDEIIGPQGNRQDGILITNLRHCSALERATEDIQRAQNALTQGLSEEFALSDLHRGLGHLGLITGETRVDDLLTEIFSRFCIGK